MSSPGSGAVALGRGDAEPVIRATGLAALLLAASLVMATTTCVTAAIPHIARDLSASQTQVQWIADAYPIVLAALLLPAGAFLDRFGRKRGLLIGLAVLTCALGWSWQAESAGQLIASRVLAGAAAALVFPGTLATIASSLSAVGRANGVALWAGSVMAGGGYGLILGGGMVEYAEWESAFLLMAILAVGCMAITVVAVPETRDEAASGQDPVGAILTLLGIGALTAAVIELPVRSLTDPIVVTGFGVGSLACVAFVLWELRHPHPLLDVRLFANCDFAGATVAILAMFGAAFGWFFLSFQYYSYVLGWGPLQSSLGLLPNIVPLVLLAPMGSRLAGRFGRRPVIAVALGVMAAGAVLTGAVGSSREFWPTAAGFFLIGAGGGLGQGPATQAIVDALPRAKQGIASAVNDVSRELGAAIGIAVVGSAFTAAYRGGVEDGLGSSVPDEVRSSPAAGLDVAASSTGQIEAIRDATVSGWEMGLAAAAAMLLAGALFVALRMR